MFSFVIYGEIDDEIFTKEVPVTNSQHAGQIVFQYGERITQLQMNSFAVKPYKGLMFVFPAGLNHYVPAYYKDFERISISGNYVLEQVPQNRVNNAKLNLK